LGFTSDSVDLAQADVFLVTVPTPVDSAKRPDLTPLEKASAAVGRALQARAALGTRTLPLVIYESTVYPGATEEVCVPILEKESGLLFNEGFYCGYSPERINPGDTEHKLTTVIKLTSGSTKEAAAWVNHLYGSIIQAGTYQAPSIRVAEAAKVIENTQRDINIALVNELAMIFRRMDIDTLDVLEAAGTKWNFLTFRPGLVGGHCIGVDPYYLTHKAEQLGYHPEIVLAGRRINDKVPDVIAERIILEMARKHHAIARSKVLVLGLTFKENCPDIRNSKVLDLVSSLKKYSIDITLVDPLAPSVVSIDDEDHLVLNKISPIIKYDVIVLAVAHDYFTKHNIGFWESLANHNAIIFDVKGVLPRALKGLMRL
jgi:UDP-N-acetyl-D-galactosamine dehydrogenase